MKKQEGLILKYRLRFWVLILICLSLVSNQIQLFLIKYSSAFIFDIPALLKPEIISHFTPIYGSELTNFYFSFLYSFYSIPNIILPLFGGTLSDKLGYRYMSTIFMTLIVIGQATIYFGACHDNLRIMVLGRFFFGLGGESLGITSSIIQIIWFSGKELSFASALILSLVRTASILNTIITPKIAQMQGMNTAFGFGFLVTLFSFCILQFLNKIDAGIESKLKFSNEKQQFEKFNLGKVVQNIKTNIRQFPRIYFLIGGLIMVFNATLFNFLSFSNPIITDLWLPKENDSELNEQLAGELMGVPFICCSLCCPIIGLYIDTKGQRTKVIMASCGFLFVGLSSLLYIEPVYSMVLIGFGYSLCATTIWTAITFIIPDSQLGSAFGVISSACNLASVIVPLIIAIIANLGNSVTVVFFFMILSLIALIISILLYKEDKKRGGKKMRNIIEQVSLDCEDQKKLMNYLKSFNIKSKLFGTLKSKPQNEGELLVQ